MNVKVSGSPKAVRIVGDTVLVSLRQAHVPPLPKGLPSCAEEQVYVLYIDRRQWERTAQGREEGHEIVAHGHLHYDAPTSTLAVLVQSLTTRHRPTSDAK